MLDRLARWIVRFKPVIVFIVKGVLGVVLLGVLFFVFELYIFPRIMTSEGARKLGLFPELAGRTTIVERRETVTVTQDENLERLVTEHGSVVVRILPETATLVGAGQAEGYLGTLVTNDGFIVTYTPTPPRRDATYSVWFSDKVKEVATFEGYDTLTNLAFYRAERKNTSAVAFTNVDDIQSGRRVACVGLSQDGRLSIFPSTIERRDQFFNLSPQTVASSEKWEGVFSLTALPGEFYLGAPALLGNGEMAGIVGSRVLDRRETAFLIPARVVRQSLDRIISGKGVRPVFGVYYISLNEERAAALGTTEKQGALVYSPSGRTGLSVIASSPAARAGLLYGDIITAVNGKVVTSESPLSALLGEFSVGDQITITVVRSGKEYKFDLAL